MILDNKKITNVKDAIKKKYLLICLYLIIFYIVLNVVWKS